MEGWTRCIESSHKRYKIRSNTIVLLLFLFFHHFTMLSNLIQFSLRYRGLILVLYGVIIIVWVYMLRSLPVDVLPNLTNPRVTVFAEAPWLGSEEVESIVAWPLERAFSNVAGVSIIRSSSALGIAVINIEFTSDTTVSINRQYIYERMLSVSLPSGIHLSLAPESALLGEILWIGLSSESGNQTEEILRASAHRYIVYWYWRLYHSWIRYW